MGIRLSITSLFTVLLAAALAPAEQPFQPDDSTWVVESPTLRPGPADRFDSVAVKDPSMVFFDGRWHVFFTARVRDEYTTGYVSAERLTDLDSAPRHQPRQVRGSTSRYACAPQVFYFQPQRLWYLIYQTRDSNYQPVYSTTKTIGDPHSWSKPVNLLDKDEGTKWIDFWVICDPYRAYLFYTRGHRDVVVRTTPLERFPQGWGEGRQVFSGVHEAVHVYKVTGHNRYHMIYELNTDGRRSFGLAAADDLSGPWVKVTDRYATGAQLRHSSDDQRWTDEVSHGEAIRAGYDQRLEYDPSNCRWLIQGLPQARHKGPYPDLPWCLGIIRRTTGGLSDVSHQ